jgi:dihydrolipoamide dehydrogenase
METLNEIGKPSMFACPDCDGALWEVGDSSPPRYRCHTGHAFSLRSLEATQSDATEEALWGAIRALEQREGVLRKLAEHGRSIGAEDAGVSVDERGFIPVDKQQRTNVPHIFAIGDVVGQPMLAHKATHEGKVAAEVAAGKQSYFDATVIPSVAYTDPEVAWAGLTEAEAKEAGLDYGKGVFPWAASGRSLSLGRDEGQTKLIFDQGSGRLLGCGIVGPDAGDLIAEAVLAIEMGCDAADLALSIHPHPTLSETVGLAAEAFEGTITDLIAPKRRKSRG